MDDDTLIPIDPDLAATDPAQPAAGHRDRRPRRSRGRFQPAVLAVIAVGGMVGATARFQLGEILPTAPGRFPWATFWTNVSGSFVLGFMLVLVLEQFPPSRYLRPFLATGILGAYTTMSTYLVEVAVLIKDGHAATGVVYGTGSIVVGLGVAYAGIVAARLTPARHRREHRAQR